MAIEKALFDVKSVGFSTGTWPRVIVPQGEWKNRQVECSRWHPKSLLGKVQVDQKAIWVLQNLSFLNTVSILSCVTFHFQTVIKRPNSGANGFMAIYGSMLLHRFSGEPWGIFSDRTFLMNQYDLATSCFPVAHPKLLNNGACPNFVASNQPFEFLNVLLAHRKCCNDSFPSLVAS